MTLHEVLSEIMAHGYDFTVRADYPSDCRREFRIRDCCGDTHMNPHRHFTCLMAMTEEEFAHEPFLIARLSEALHNVKNRIPKP